MFYFLYKLLFCLFTSHTHIFYLPVIKFCRKKKLIKNIFLLLDLHFKNNFSRYIKWKMVEINSSEVVKIIWVTSNIFLTIFYSRIFFFLSFQSQNKSNLFISSKLGKNFNIIFKLISQLQVVNWRLGKKY